MRGLFPFETDREDRSWLLGLALVALCQVVAVGVCSWFAVGGHFMLPLDDPYIHLQYARMIAAGSPLVYTEGMTPSGGMTSPLYVLLFVPAMVAGLDGVKGAALAFLLGGALWMLLPVWVYQLAKRLSNCLCGAIAAGLVLANGHLLWNFLSGMETGLFTVMLVGVPLAAACWWGSERLYARTMLFVLLALLPLVRPEAVAFLALVIVLVLVRRGDHPRLSVPVLVACAVPFALWLLLLKTMTGDWRPAGLIVKGLGGNPYLTLTDKLGIAAETLTAIVTRFHFNTIPDPAYALFKGTDTMPYLAPGTFLLAMLGGAFLLVAEWRAGRPGAGSLLALCWLGGLASLAASLLPFIHQQRYVAPYTALAIVLAVLGMRRLGQLFQQHEETAIKAMGLALFLMSLPSLLFWTAEHGRNSRDIFHVLRRATFPLQASNEPIAITDAGVLAYYSNRPMWDLVGLGSAEFSRATQAGEGATLEVLAALPEERRPVALATYREWFSAAFPLEPAEWIVSVPRVSITSGSALGYYPIDWEGIELGGAPPVPQERVLLELNTGNTTSESAADYDFEIGIYDYDRRAWPQPLAPVAAFLRPATTAADPASTATLVLVPAGEAVDGGRMVRSESFLFLPEQWPTDAWLVARVGPPTGLPGATVLHVTAQSRATGAVAEDTVEMPAGVGYVAVALGDLLDRAGGELGGQAPEALRGWRLGLHAPVGAAFTSYRTWIVDGDPALTVSALPEQDAPSQRGADHAAEDHREVP